MKSPQAVVRSYDAVLWHRTKFRRTRTIACGHFVRRTSVFYTRTITCAVACDRAIACAELKGTTKSPQAVVRRSTMASYDSLWPFRPSYECILHSYDSLCRCLWVHDSLWRPLRALVTEHTHHDLSLRASRYRNAKNSIFSYTKIEKKLFMISPSPILKSWHAPDRL